MNRRSFLGLLAAVPAGLMAAARGMASVLPMSSVARLTPDIRTMQLKSLDWKVLPARSYRHQIIPHWFQTSRQRSFTTLEYEDAIDVTFGLPAPELRRNWHARRIERSRNRLAELRVQPALPLP